MCFFEGFAARLDESEDRGGNHAAYGRFAYQTDRFGATYRYLDLGENFRPGVGFVRRPDSRENFGELRYSPRPSFDRVRKFELETGLRYIENQASVLETREGAAALTTELETGDRVTFTYANRFELLEDAFPIAGGLVVPEGAYDFSTYLFTLDTFRRRFTTLDFSYETGGFFGGERDRVEVRGDFQLSRFVRVTADYEVNWIKLNESEVTTHLYSGRFQLAFRNDVVLQSLFQYNSDTDQLSSNIRFNWIPKPGSDFFIVYNELDEWGNSFGVKNRSLSVKLDYLFAI